MENVLNEDEMSWESFWGVGKGKKKILTLVLM